MEADSKNLHSENINPLFSGKWYHGQGYPRVTQGGHCNWRRWAQRKLLVQAYRSGGGSMRKCKLSLRKRKFSIAPWKGIHIPGRPGRKKERREERKSMRNKLEMLLPRQRRAGEHKENKGPAVVLASVPAQPKGARLPPPLNEAVSTSLQPTTMPYAFQSQKTQQTHFLRRKKGLKKGLGVGLQSLICVLGS